MQKNKKRLLLLGSCILILAAIVLMAHPESNANTWAAPPGEPPYPPTYHPYYFMGMFAYMAPQFLTVVFSAIWLLVSVWKGIKARDENRNVGLWVLAIFSSFFAIFSVFFMTPTTLLSIVIAGLVVVAGVIQIAGCIWFYARRFACRRNG